MNVDKQNRRDLYLTLIFVAVPIVGLGYLAVTSDIDLSFGFISTLVISMVLIGFGAIALQRRTLARTSVDIDAERARSAQVLPWVGVFWTAYSLFQLIYVGAEGWVAGFHILMVWFWCWLLNGILAKRGGRLAASISPAFFGIVVLVLWELIIGVFEVPLVILPAPSAIWGALIANVPTLWVDFVQTVLKSVIPGYIIGCSAAFLTAIAIDRSPFLQRGLLPIGNLAAALPIVGIAPIMVMWFGFDWHSKAAVVVVMCFFPMLVNTMEGLQTSDKMQRDLMLTYNASYMQTLLKLRLPTAMPFVFNGLKICTTLALIGAIVAEFFGTPIVGMGFRISTEIGRMALDMVWAEIAVAALSGSLFYGLVALLERSVTFWHPSIRN